MSDYYPEFYVRKRQRELAYRKTSLLVFGGIGIVLLGGLVGFFIYNNVIAAHRTDPGATPELAERKQELETESRQQEVSAAVREQTDLPAVDPDEIKLENIQYSESFPKVEVSVAGGIAAVADPSAVEAADVDAVAESEAAPPGGGRDPDDLGADPPVAAAVPPVDKPEDRYTPERKVDDKPKPAPAKEAKKVAEKPKEKPAPPPEKSEVAPPPVKSQSKFTYRVYAGKYLGKDEAVKATQELGAIGLSGILIDGNTGDYLVLVGTVEDEAGANALKDKLVSSGFGGTLVTRKAEK
jgi:cell division protein FtsN